MTGGHSGGTISAIMAHAEIVVALMSFFALAAAWFVMPATAVRATKATVVVEHAPESIAEAA